MTLKAEIAANAKIRPLADNELDAVSGGVTFNEIVIVKRNDKSSAGLPTQAATAPAGS